MITWRDGRAILAKHYSLMKIPTEVFLKDIAEYKPQRITGTAVFMSISPEGIPHTLLHHFKHNEALHERVLHAFHSVGGNADRGREDRVRIEALGQGFYRIKAQLRFHGKPGHAGDS